MKPDDTNDRTKIRRRAWSKRAKGAPLTPEEIEELRHYDRELDDESSRTRIPTELWEKTSKVAKSLGTSPHHYLRHLLRAELAGELVARERLTDLQRKFESEVRDALRAVDDTNRRLMSSLREREDAIHERDALIDMMEATANRFDEICNLFGAPEHPRVEFGFLGPGIPLKDSKDGEESS